MTNPQGSVDTAQFQELLLRSFSSSLSVGERAVVLDTDSRQAMRMADEALGEACIPHPTVEFTKSRRSMGMPCAPTLGRGYRWQITVRQEREAEPDLVLRYCPRTHLRA